MATIPEMLELRRRRLAAEEFKRRKAARERPNLQQRADDIAARLDAAGFFGPNPNAGRPPLETGGTTPIEPSFVAPARTPGGQLPAFGPEQQAEVASTLMGRRVQRATRFAENTRQQDYERRLGRPITAENARVLDQLLIERSIQPFQAFEVMPHVRGQLRQLGISEQQLVSDISAANEPERRSVVSKGPLPHQVPTEAQLSRQAAARAAGPARKAEVAARAADVRKRIAEREAMNRAAVELTGEGGARGRGILQREREAASLADRQMKAIEMDALAKLVAAGKVGGLTVEQEAELRTKAAELGITGEAFDALITPGRRSMQPGPATEQGAEVRPGLEFKPAKSKEGDDRVDILDRTTNIRHQATPEDAGLWDEAFEAFGIGKEPTGGEQATVGQRGGAFLGVFEWPGISQEERAATRGALLGINRVTRIQDDETRKKAAMSLQEQLNKTGIDPALVARVRKILKAIASGQDPPQKDMQVLFDIARGETSMHGG